MGFIDVITKTRTKIVCENDLFFAYLDDRPITLGHTIIFPKEFNNSSYFDLDYKHVIQLHDIIAKSKKILQKKYNPDGWNVVINDGEQAGKIIDQFGLHLIPRYKGDVHNPVASGARTILGKFVEPARLDDKKYALNECINKNILNKAFVDETNPNKEFYLGLKGLLINSLGDILVLHPDMEKDFVGLVDLPGGRCEARDKELLPAFQREVFEETGIFVNQALFFDTFVLWDKEFKSEIEVPTGLMLNIYLVHVGKDANTILNKNKGYKKFSWVSPAKASDLLVQYPLRVRNKIKSLSFTD